MVCPWLEPVWWVPVWLASPLSCSLDKSLELIDCELLLPIGEWYERSLPLISQGELSVMNCSRRHSR